MKLGQIEILYEKLGKYRDNQNLLHVCLWWILECDNRYLSSREIARQKDVTRRTAMRWLAELSDYGALKKERRGSMMYYKLNVD